MYSTLVVRTLVTIAALATLACGRSASPSATLAFSLTASPSPTSGGLCAGCGAGSTERESKTTITIRETGGVAGTVTSIAMVLREDGTNAVITQGEFDAAAVAQMAGTNRLAANGTLAVLCGVHYPPAQQGRVATLTYTVQVRDDRGTLLTRDIAVSITST